MSNKNLDCSLEFLWHKTPLKQKVIIIVIIGLSISFAFGLGLMMADRTDRAPIIIEQCPEMKLE